MITQTYKLNLQPNGMQEPYVNVSQFDVGSRTIEFTLYDGTGLFEIPSGSTVTVRGTKPDNTGFEYSCTYEGSVVSFDIQDQMTVISGIVPAEIRIVNNGEIIGSRNFAFRVERTPLDPNVTISETELPMIEYMFDNWDSKMDKVANPNAGDILIVDANGQAIDSDVPIDQLLRKDLMTWRQISTLVKNGKFADWFSVGDQISDTWKEVSTGTEYTVPWDVVHIDEDDNVYMQWDYATPTGVPFDEPEAIYYFDGTEQPGTYEITIGSKYGTGWVVNQIIAFTLTAAPSEGDQFVISLGTNNANSPIGRTWNVYAKGSTISKQSGTTFAGDGTGINLGTIGLESTQKPNGRLNAINRAVFGSNRWSQSAMRQYLNSDLPKGNWWTPQNDWDRPVGVATTLDGFLFGCTEDFKDSLDTVEVVTALNTVEGYPTPTETTMDKIFLPSFTNMYINPEYVEGVEWDFYKDLASQAGLTGKFAQGGTYPVLISYNLASQASPVIVRLRSVTRYSASYTWYVSSSGAVYNYYAYSDYRSRPACKFLASK